jgi:alkanesulfonate monooxygenase SsuD/methylene tetrahydromethanopterin reductase-like flavin-dependent oxidoreductase (luciferase family)
MSSTWPLSPWVEKHRSRIGFALQVFPKGVGADRSRQLIETGLLAESLGYDAFLIGDHPARGPEPWLHLAALATATQRIRLGSLVNCIHYRHPLMVARLAADLDHLSQGRLILGLGIGWDIDEFANFAFPFLPARQRQAALEEALGIIHGVWGDRPFSLQGLYFQVENAQVLPPPLQRPSPPLIIAGGGERVTLRQVAQYADACNFLAFERAGGVRTPDDVRRKLAALRRHCEALSRPYESILRTHMTGWLILAEDEARLQRKVTEYVPEGIERRFTGAWSGFAVAATPPQAVAHYQALADAGIQYFVIQLPDAADQETIRLFAEQVIPKLKVREDV